MKTLKIIFFVVLVLAIISTILLVIQRGKIQKMTDEKNEQEAYISLFSAWFRNQSYYNTEFMKLRAEMYATDETESYSKCMQYYDQEIKGEASDNANIESNMIFFSAVYERKKTPNCLDSLNKYKEKVTDWQTSRGEWLVELKKWCYGFHNVTYDDEWDSQYKEPFRIASEKYNSAMTVYKDTEMDLVKSCVI